MEKTGRKALIVLAAALGIAAGSFGMADAMSLEGIPVAGNPPQVSSREDESVFIARLTRSSHVLAANPMLPMATVMLLLAETRM